MCFVLHQDVTWQDVDFSEGTTVEDLWRAEQILLGPTEKVDHPRDCVGVDIDINTKLSSGLIVVFHISEVGNSVFIDLCKADVKTRIFGSKGDRLFQFFQIQANEWIEDESGFLMQRDFPVHHPIMITVRQEIVDISPTISFDIIAEPDIQPNLPIHHMANQEMTESTMHYAPFALDRWKTMSTFDEMMGDDEMAFMLSYAEEKSGIGFAGIYQWDAELGLSKKDSGTSKLTEHKFGSRFGALVIRDHWIPFVVTHGTDLCSVVDYGHYVEIPKPLLKQLCLQIFGHSRVIGHWVELLPEPGWCGFAAVSWILGKFATPVYARSMDEIQPHILQIQEIAGVELWSKIWNIEQRCPSDRWKWVILLRHEFIISQITSPTVPVLHAGGQEDAAMLKARGKIASVLISKGHQAKESIEIAETISRQLGDSKQVKQFAHQKEESIYHGVIERCQKSGIPISQAAQSAAAEKLPKFFRSKQQAKKSPTINFKLHDVSFPANAFTNPNGDSLVVQENWTIVTRGVAIADPVEVQEVADAGRLVSTECCGALTLTAIKTNGLITSELITVQVTEAFQNKALIRVFLTQLGSKKVMKVPAKDIEIKLSPLRTLAFSVHKCLVDEPFWLALMKGPAKAILESMAIGPEQKINQIYSRRWTAKGRVVEKQDAETFGMLCLVDEAATKTWLARSGTDRNPIFISGKRQNDAHQEEAHRVIWSGKCIKDALIQIALIQDHAGIVYKPPGSFGIRVQTSRFASAWVELKGSGIDVPSQVHSTYKYAFAGLPPGLSGPHLETWASEAKWQVRVLKKYQDGRFLVGSDTVKPDQRLAMNGQEILIVEHQDRKPATKPLVAGTLKSTDKGKDPFMTDGGDPWQKMSRSTSTAPSRPFNAWAKYRPSGDVPMDGDGPVLSGDPADQIFKNQNERITSIEAKMQTLEARLTEGQNSNLQKFEKIESDISGIEHSLRGSLKEALSQQSEQLLATFESLLKRSPRAKDIKRDRPERSTSRSPRGGGS